MKFSRIIAPYKKILSVLIFCSVILIVYNLYLYGVTQKKVTQYSHLKIVPNISSSVQPTYKAHQYILKAFFDGRVDWPTSNLGSILFKSTQYEDLELKPVTNKTFIILVWKYYDWLKHRHIEGFGSSYKDPLESCNVKNCEFIGNDDEINSADAVLIHLQHGLVPKVEKRDPKQIWVFLTDESPKNSFSLVKTKTTIKDFVDIFNWSMTYRSDSDVPVPYGRVIPRSKPMRAERSFQIVDVIPFWQRKRRDVLAAVLISNCHVPHRNIFLKELKEHMKVNVYGACSDSEENKKICPGHFKSDCEVVSQYLFYLVIENSLCQEYLTEKVFYHAYNKGAIPVIMGPSVKDCRYLLPPHSFLHVDDYEKIEDLAEHIQEISKDHKKIISYHWWRNNFDIANEHGYFGTKSYHFCRLCQAMNYNNNAMKVYDEYMLREFLDPARTCR